MQLPRGNSGRSNFRGGSVVIASMEIKMNDRGVHSQPDMLSVSVSHSEGPGLYSGSTPAVLHLLVWRDNWTDCLVPRMRTKSKYSQCTSGCACKIFIAVGNRRRVGSLPGCLSKMD